MMSAQQALQIAEKYEAMGKHEVAKFYINCARKRQQPRHSTCNLIQAYNAMRSAKRTITGSIHK